MIQEIKAIAEHALYKIDAYSDDALALVVRTGMAESGYRALKGYGDGNYTASRHILNKTFIKTNEFMGRRPLGTTIEFIPSSSNLLGGQYFDGTFLYPSNHVYVVGSSRDSIDRLIYKGTQNLGGDVIESLAYNDLTSSAYYFVLTSGGQSYTVNAP